MKVTGWTYWGDNNYVDLDVERRSLINPNKKIPSPGQLKKILEETGQTSEEWHAEFEKIPFYIDDNEAKRKIDEYTKIRDTVIDYCVKNKIYVTDNNHQYSDFGAPIVDNKYIYCDSLLGWSDVMAKAWSIINEKSYRNLDFYCDLKVRADIDGTVFNKPKKEGD